MALTGDGGDEAFAGYDFMMQAVRIWGDGEQRRAFMRPMTPSEHLWEWKLRIAVSKRIFLIGATHSFAVATTLVRADFSATQSLGRGLCGSLGLV